MYHLYIIYIYKYNYIVYPFILIHNKIKNNIINAFIYLQEFFIDFKICYYNLVNKINFKSRCFDFVNKIINNSLLK